MKRYCPACGNSLDENGLCINAKCKRAKLQSVAKEKREAANAEKDKKDKARLETRAAGKIKAISQAKIKATALNVKLKK